MNSSNIVANLQSTHTLSLIIAKSSNCKPLRPNAKQSDLIQSIKSVEFITAKWTPETTHKAWKTSMNFVSNFNNLLIRPHKNQVTAPRAISSLSNQAHLKFEPLKKIKTKD